MRHFFPKVSTWSKSLFFVAILFKDLVSLLLKCKHDGFIFLFHLERILCNNRKVIDETVKI